MRPRVNKQRLVIAPEMPICRKGSESPATKVVGAIKVKASPAPTLSEKQIENMILNYLRSERIFAFKVKTVGTYDPKLKRFRASSGLYMKGVADILGIFNHRFMAIEVKSAKGVLQEHQKIFLRSVLDNGGIAFVARSLEDVREKLMHWDFNKTEEK